MSRYRALAVVFVVLLAACGEPSDDAAGTTTTGGVTYSVTGQAHAGPTCPVMQDPPDPECADRPVDGAVILVLDSKGAQVAETVTGIDGTFTLQLPAGEYSLVAQPVEGLMGTPTAQQISVVAGPVMGIDLGYDTGIR